MEPELTQFEKEYRDALPEFLRPSHLTLTSGLVERWVNACIEFEEESNLPSREYIESFQSWSGVVCTTTALNKILRRLGFYVGKLARVNGEVHRCWVNVRLKEALIV